MPWSTILRINAAGVFGFFRVDAAGGLVEQHQFRIGGHGQRERHRLRSSWVVSAMPAVADVALRPTKSSTSAALARHFFSSSRSRLELMITSHSRDWGAACR